MEMHFYSLIKEYTEATFLGSMLAKSSLLFLAQATYCKVNSKRGIIIL